MDRRSFLKAIGLAAVAAAVPAIAVRNAYPLFDPEKSYGDGFFVTDWIDADFLSMVKETLDPTIADAIPPNYRQAIDWIVIQPQPDSVDPLLRDGFIGWKFPGNYAMRRAIAQ